MSIFIIFLLTIHVMVSLLIILLVLMQRPKSEGLGAAFGGGMTDNLFGAQTTNVLQKATRWLGGIFFALTLLLSILYSRQGRANMQTTIQHELASAPAAKTPLDPSMAPLVDAKPKPGDMNVPVNSSMSADDLKKILMQKVADANAAKTSGSAAPAPADNTKPGDGSLNLQLQPGATPADDTGKPNELSAPKLQLQTGTSKKDGL